jgi:phage terminase large subunit-like protein
MATIQFGALTTTAATADQVITTFTPAAGTSWKSLVISGYLTAWSATEANMGVVKVKVATVDKIELRIQNTDNDTVAGVVIIPLGGITFSGSEVVAVTVTPASTTSMRWAATLIGQG